MRHPLLLMIVLLFSAETLLANNNAAFVSQCIGFDYYRHCVVGPTRWFTAGSTQTVYVTMQNNGDTTWTAAAGYKLGAWNPTDSTTWVADPRVYLSPTDAIAPGQNVSFTITIHVPDT